MSAWIVEKKHIDYLVTAVVGRDVVTLEQADQTGRMLWAQCLRSVAYRYPDDKDGQRPAPSGFRDVDVETYLWEEATAPSDVALHSLIRCYCYQSCEDPGWEDTEAYKLMEKLDEPLKDCETETEWWGPPPEEEEPA